MSRRLSHYRWCLRKGTSIEVGGPCVPTVKNYAGSIPIRDHVLVGVAIEETAKFDTHVIDKHEFNVNQRTLLTCYYCINIFSGRSRR